MPAKGTSPRERWNPLLKSYPDSEKVNAVSIEAEVLLTRLIAVADDHGNCYGNGYHLWASTCRRRLDSHSICKALNQLLDQGLVIPYKHDGETYLHLDSTIAPREKRRAAIILCPLPKADLWWKSIIYSGGGTVYFIEQDIEGNKFIKIGFTNGCDTSIRRAQISRDVGRYVTVVAVTNNVNIQLEAALHDTFEEDRVGGEWHNLTPRLAEMIRVVKDA